MSKLANQSRFRIQRALGMELPGLGKGGALERRAYPPGQHGLARRKYSEYGIRLREKQKLKFHYGLREEQLKRLVRKAKKSSDPNWMNQLIGDLESRIDNVVFRLGFAPSIPAARQWVSHGHVLVNGKRLSIASATLKPGARVALSTKIRNSAGYQTSRQQPRLLLAEYLEVEKEGEWETGRFKHRPDFGNLPFPLEANLVIEYYSKTR